MTSSKKGLIDPAVIQFLTGNMKGDETDRQSVASWGTGDTEYTEIVEQQDSSSTVSSSITQEPSLEVMQDIQRKKELVIDKLKENGIPDKNIQNIMNNAPPYELVFSGIQLQTWLPDKEIFYIMALYQSQTTTTTINKNDDG